MDMITIIDEVFAELDAQYKGVRKTRLSDTYTKLRANILNSDSLVEKIEPEFRREYCKQYFSSITRDKQAFLSHGIRLKVYSLADLLLPDNVDLKLKAIVLLGEFLGSLKVEQSVEQGNLSLTRYQEILNQIAIIENEEQLTNKMYIGGLLNGLLHNEGRDTDSF